MKSFWRTFLKGFVTVIPLFITLYLFFWIVVTAESMVYGILKMVLTDKLYIPGMGIVLAFVIFYMLGLLMEKQKIVRKLSDFSERQVARIPILKSFYSSLKNLMNFFIAAQKDEEDGLYKVVMVNLTDELHLIGFVTGDAQDQLGFTPDTKERIIAVYMPMSYQVGGYTVYLPQSRVTPLDIDFEEATQIVLTAGVGKKKAVI
jgi:uncharacterized membrane protein